LARSVPRLESLGGGASGGEQAKARGGGNNSAAPDQAKCFSAGIRHGNLLWFDIALFSAISDQSTHERKYHQDKNAVLRALIDIGKEN
jgi:hypothetical protein